MREQAGIGRGCVISKDVYIDAGVQIGDNVKIQNGVSVYHGVTIEDGVFVGPSAIFTNDRRPRAINPDGTLKGAEDWQVSPTHICHGASIGAGAVVLPVRIGAWAMVGAGAVVTHDVPEQALVLGSPARVVGYVCRCGARLAWEAGLYRCPDCQAAYPLPPLNHSTPD
ncbi:MAG: acyltransferase [Chloroflexota bacterium]